VEDIGSLLKLRRLCKSHFTGCTIAADQVWSRRQSDLLGFGEDGHLQRILNFAFSFFLARGGGRSL